LHLVDIVDTVYVGQAFDLICIMVVNN